MNNLLRKALVCSLLAAGIVACSAQSEQQGKPAKGANKAAASPEKQSETSKTEIGAEPERVVRKSVFEEPPLRPGYADPFFPLSSRLQPVKPEPGADQPRPTASIDQVILKGVSGTDGKRFALINRKTFAAGESGTVQTPRGAVNIEVLEVKERSAIIKVENDPDPKEIYLRPEP